MAAAAPPLLPDASRAPQLLAAIWTPFPFALFFLAARFYIRISRRRLASDDWLMLLGAACYAVFAGLATAMFALGGGRHMAYLEADPRRLDRILELQAVMKHFGTLSLLFVKASVALLLPHLVANIASWQLWFLAVNMGIYTLVILASIATDASQCTPAWALWHPDLVRQGLASCPRSNASNIVMTAALAFGAYLNVALVLLPISILFSLRSSRHKRIAISCLVLGGIFAGVCGIGQAVEARRYNFDSDRTWDMYGLVIWTALQMPLFIIAGSIPPSKPLFDLIFRRRRLSLILPPHQPSSTTALNQHSKKFSFFGGTDKGDSSVNVNGGILMEKSIEVEQSSPEGGQPPISYKWPHDERWALSPEDVVDKI